MKNNLGKILKGDSKQQQILHSGYQSQIKKIVEVWEGKNDDDFGLLRLFRLLLVSLLMFFPGVLIDEIFKTKSYLTKKLVIEAYVVFKILFPLFVLKFGWFSNDLAFYGCIYLLIETYIYLFGKIFIVNQHQQSSNMRTLLLLTLNFLESGLTFAIIYLSGNYLNVNLVNALDAIYYSFVTSATIGYGDFYPVTDIGKKIVIIQIFCSVSFIVLFFNFFSGKANQLKA